MVFQFPADAKDAPIEVVGDEAGVKPADAVASKEDLSEDVQGKREEVMDELKETVAEDTPRVLTVPAKEDL